VSIDAGGFNPWGSWEDFSATLNRQGFAWRNLIGQNEQGGWTPTLTFGGGSTGITYLIRTGHWVKFGRVVHAHCSILLSSKGSSTGAAVITGLPYKTPSSNTAAGTSPVYWTGMTTSIINLTAVVVGTDRTQVDLYGLTAGATSIGLITEGDFANTSEIQFGITYLTLR
jgi:hypothetical protein